MRMRLGVARPARARPTLSGDASEPVRVFVTRPSGGSPPGYLPGRAHCWRRLALRRSPRKDAAVLFRNCPRFRSAQAVPAVKVPGNRVLARVTRISAIVLFTLLGAPTAAVLGAGAASASAQGSPLAWGQPSSVDARQGGISSVSCPTTGFCMAVDSSGHAVALNGSTWGTPALVSPDDLVSVSCPTSGFCVAVDDQGDYFTYNGSAWNGPNSLDGSGFTAVSCPSPSFCVAVDYSGNAFAFNGSAWSEQTGVGPDGELSGFLCQLAVLRRRRPRGRCGDVQREQLGHSRRRPGQ
jgi:hypothetical protein